MFLVLLQVLAEFLNSFQAFFDVRHAGGVADAEVVVSAERDAGHGGDLLRFEQLRAEFGGLKAGLGNVREQVKRALCVDARNTGNAVQLLVRETAAFVEFHQPGFQMIH